MWYLTTSTATLFGATRRQLLTADASSETSFTAALDTNTLIMSVGTCTSTGGYTVRATGSLVVGANAAKAARTISVTIPQDYAIPAGGGVAVLMGGQSWYSPATSGYLKAGTHQFTITCKDVTDAYGNTITVYYGGQASYAPAGLFGAGPWAFPVLVSAPASHDAPTEVTIHVPPNALHDAPTAATIAAIASHDAPTSVAIEGSGWTFPVVVSAPASHDAPTEVTLIAGSNASHDAATRTTIAAAASHDAPTEVGIDYGWVTLAAAHEASTFEDTTVVLGETYQYRVTDALGNVLLSDPVTFASASASHDAPTEVQVIQDTALPASSDAPMSVTVSADATDDAPTLATISADALMDAATEIVLAAQAAHDAETLVIVQSGYLAEHSAPTAVTRSAGGTHDAPTVTVIRSSYTPPFRLELTADEGTHLVLGSDNPGRRTISGG